ncbi:subunit beta of mRNA capping enzyme [Ordospora colligata]|nr:subunit beta of mRNA capping enzyme [Ordospora colligata]TBU19093.1 subunit beta of mRNA capping enzyme [Ordospora colligata]
MDVPEKILNGPVLNHIECLRRFILAFKNERQELEIRLGRIVGKDDGMRMKMDAVAPIVFKNLPADYKFESAVDSEDFRKLKELFSKHLSEKKEDVIVINEDGRETYEGNVLKKVEKKIRTEKLDIYLPGKKYDVRLVLNEEKETFKQASKKKTLVKRIRKRETYFIEPYGFDFTEVLVSGDRDEKKKLEVEVEVFDSEKLVSGNFISLIHNFNIDLVFK